MSLSKQMLFQQITHGVYVISTCCDKKSNAFTAAWVMQVSFSPLLICFSINPNHRSYQLLKGGGGCCISVLENNQFLEAEHFARSDLEDKMAGFQWLKTNTGAYALSNCLTYFDCRVNDYFDAGDHKLVVCQVLDAVMINKGDPMLYQSTGNMDNSQQLFVDKK